MHYLIADLVPLEFSTRPRKICQSLSPLGHCEYVSLQEAGRFGWRATSHTSAMCGSVRVIPNRSIDRRRNRLSSLRNLMLSYAFPILRLGREIAANRADVVFIENPVLLLFGVVQRMRRKSFVVFDARERLGGVQTPHSLRSVWSRMERNVLQLLAKRVDLCLAVCESHAREYRALGFNNVLVVRNVPRLSDSPALAPPNGGTLRVAYIGTLYEGRGLEMLIDALSSVRKGIAAEVEITGHGSVEYVAKLKDRAEREGVADLVHFLGPCGSGDVHSRYQACHAGAVLYEAVDDANDSLSNKLFETMAAGRAVLATNLPETAAIVEGFDAGVVVSPDAEGVARGLVELGGDLVMARDFGKNARRAISERLNWESEFAVVHRLIDGSSSLSGPSS